MTRDVYECLQDKECVIKHEPRGDSFQNVLEWEVWNSVKGTKFAKWFAPCIDISGNGLYLIQKKAEMIPESDYPKKIPHFLTDLKFKNFGKIGKQFVCVDYGTTVCLSISKSLTHETKKAKWWKE